MRVWASVSATPATLISDIIEIPVLLNSCKSPRRWTKRLLPPTRLYPNRLVILARTQTASILAMAKKEELRVEMRREKTNFCISVSLEGMMRWMCWYKGVLDLDWSRQGSAYAWKVIHMVVRRRYDCFHLHVVMLSLLLSLFHFLMLGFFTSQPIDVWIIIYKDLIWHTFIYMSYTCSESFGVSSRTCICIITSCVACIARSPSSLANRLSPHLHCSLFCSFLENFFWFNLSFSLFFRISFLCCPFLLKGCCIFMQVGGTSHREPENVEFRVGGLLARQSGSEETPVCNN